MFPSLAPRATRATVRVETRLLLTPRAKMQDNKDEDRKCSKLTGSGEFEHDVRMQDYQKHPFWNPHQHLTDTAK